MLSLFSKCPGRAISLGVGESKILFHVSPAKSGLGLPALTFKNVDLNPKNLLSINSSPTIYSQI